MSPRWASEGNPYGPMGMGDGPPALHGCHTCGGYGNRHDPVAHGIDEPDEQDRCTCLPYPYGDGPEIDCPEHGATDEDLAAMARDEPEPPAKCRCSHAKSQHGRGEGQCYLGACGCSTYRPKEIKQ
jgi:hypothetical protein